MLKIMECIDAGSEYCPCHLAETGECIMCSQLQGKTFCDCRNWKGVCIYQHFVSNREQKKERRSSFSCEILSVNLLSDSAAIMQIKTSKTLARELNVPGAYVFLRSPEDPEYYDTPMSVMAVDEANSTLLMAIAVRGIKTKILSRLAGEISVRGPYWNGLLGLKHIKTLRNSNALLVVRGIAQAAAVPVAKKLMQAGNRIKVILDKGRDDLDFAWDYFVAMGCEITACPVLDGKSLKIPEEARKYITKRLVDEEIKLVYSGGTEKFHEGISSILAALDSDIFFTSSNDAKFCCGEGICGSCHIRLGDGTRIKTCKTQLSPAQLLGGRKY